MLAVLVQTLAPVGAGTTSISRVSISSYGVEGNGTSARAAISADGQFVAFWSRASNLVAADNNGFADVFVRDLASETTARVSIATDGSEGNDDSYFAASSADGRYIVFDSLASNLINGDSNGFQVSDVFLRDRLTETTELVSVNSSGVQGDGASLHATINADGRYVAFTSAARNLVEGDTINESDVFIRDRFAGSTRRVSIDSSGAQANRSSAGPSLGISGRYVAFWSLASNLVASDTNGVADVFVHDRVSELTSRVSVSTNGVEGNNESAYPAISGNGRYVAFWSSASNLVDGDSNNLSDIFVHDRVSGTTVAVSVNEGGDLGNDGSWERIDITDDGGKVAFWSYASNLAPADMNNAPDVFVRDLQMDSTELVSIDNLGLQGNNFSEMP